ncbi:DUF29 domain-containing protein [Chroococcus sp. FPU101]|uniref:DUF29 domain-containing protein n=1 Tax=Chroococcus sp. FPU101 TaxID=1974212 RepID=UPI001A8C657A|nr:DUF29 domain-containing protein [Chroococcus sp. FPU101]GFE68285.1 hypothetical protein CFPU101_08950 [Chroococcus sp. FPU101]
MKTQTSEEIKSLYEQDFLLWTERIVEQLQTKDIAHLDWENLIEEIKSLGYEEKRKVDSYAKQLLLHLLLYQYWLSEREFCKRGWRTEITNFRDELEDLFQSETLYNYYLQRLEEVYRKSRRLAIEKTGLTASNFPQDCPYTIEQILDFDFFPD